MIIDLTLLHNDSKDDESSPGNKAKMKADYTDPGTGYSFKKDVVSK